MIGLGGTGGKVLAAFRRLIFQHHREAEPSNLAIDYLYIDTSAKDVAAANITAPLQAGERVWRTLGHSVQLNPANIIHLKQGNFSQILNNIEEYPTIEPWLGNRDIWKKIWDSAPNGIEAGGQLRRFGRFLFAQNAPQVSKAISERFAEASRGGIADTQWTVHIVAGLAGGTGSGTFIDVIGQIRALEIGKDAKVVLYAVLPETADTPWARENYFANGYAALAELNGLLVRQFRPHDSLRPGERYNLAALPGNKTFADNTFVITNRNSNGLVVDMDQVLPEIVGETLYQIVVASGDAWALGSGGNVGGTGQRLWRDMVTGENYFGGSERDVAEGADQRANRFLSFGVKRIAIPHQEVREYASMIFLRQFLFQSLNNSWVDGQGFINAQRPFDATREARSEGARQDWRLSDAHLMLEAPTLQNDPITWRSTDDDFRATVEAQCTSLIKTDSNKPGWAGKLEALAREFHEKSYRRTGVAETYRVAERTIPERARYIVRTRMSDRLFERWSAGELSIRDVLKIVNEVSVDMKDRNAAASVKMENLNTGESVLEKTRQDQLRHYLDRGLIGRVVRNREQELRAYGATIAQLYAIKARKLAIPYMQKLLIEVLDQVQSLKADLEQIVLRLDEAVETVEVRRAQRVKVEAEAAVSHQYKLYDPQHIRNLLTRLEQSRQIQDDQTQGLRSALLGQLGAQPGFAAFVEKLPAAQLVEELESEAERRAEEALSAVDSERDRILEASIVQKLYEEYAGREEALRRFIAERVLEAGTFAPMNNTEELTGKTTEGVLVAFVPAVAELRENLSGFHATLLDILRNSGAGRRVDIVETHGRGHEIVILSLVNQFPLRYLTALDFLQSKYKQLIGGRDAARKRLELHTDGDGTDLPRLYPERPEELRKRLKAHWLIAETTGLLVERPNPTNGRVEVVLFVTDADGAEDVVVVGESLARRTATLTVAGGRALENAAASHLEQLMHIDDRAALRKKLIDLQNAALREAKGDATKPSFVELRESIDHARAMLAD